MPNESNQPDRRTFLKIGAMSVAGCAIARHAFAQGSANAPAPSAATPLFDGTTLNGWIDAENNATAFGGGDIGDLIALANRISDTADPVSSLVTPQLDDAVKTTLADYSPAMSDADVKALKSALEKNLNRIIASGPFYDPSAFQNVALRPETQALLAQNPHGADLMHLNRLLLEDAYSGILAKSVAAGWIVKDGAIASVGAGRGVLYTAGDYGRFRLMFSMRHVSGNPDHQACILIFCTRPPSGEVPLDALGGIQFQVPLGGHWDYRPGKNNDGGAEFTRLVTPDFDPHQWSQVEILADAATGTARMGVYQGDMTKAVEVLDFTDPTAGKAGPIALQMHNAGLFDEYKDIRIEVNPKVNDLIAVRYGHWLDEDGGGSFTPASPDGKAGPP